ncbi:MAG TPA: hypothetical protein PLX33_04515 [Alphaproteobacteria bacterium]|nr:hypothetical protein [Alphaproteobacteria bacterium]
MTWEKSTKEFVVSDVIEWTETIWPPRNPRSRKKPRPWGKQKVTAQITEIDTDYIKLTVLKSEIAENIIGSELKPHKIGLALTKRKETILKGEPQRLHWSEEDVRLFSLNQKD